MNTLPSGVLRAKCALIHDDALHRLSDTQLQLHLQDCIDAELALMAQYLYMLSTLPALSVDTPTTQATTIRSIAKRLHLLAIGEMGHAATAANLLVLFGGAPHFRGREAFDVPPPDASGDPKESRHEFRLAPISAAHLQTLLRYERRDPHSSLPFEAVAAFDTPNERIGRIYRRVYYELCIRNESVTSKELHAKHPIWAPFVDMQSGKPSTSILPRPHDGIADQYHYDEILWALRHVLTEGEGGVDAEETEVHSHVNLLESIAANLQRLPESLAREVMIDPSVHDDGLSPAALHFARASCQAYEVTFASLYALWLRAFELKARQQFYFSLTGFMAVVFAGVANLTARTPATAHRAVLMGPTFETLRAVPTPRTRDHACTMIVERIVDLQRTLAQPLPRGIEGGPTQTWYRERIASLKAPIARYLEQVKTLATSN